MLITSKEGELNMKIKVMLLGALIIMSLLLASCVTYDAPAEEVELVDDELADVDADVGEEETVEGTAEEVEDTEEAEDLEETVEAEEVVEEAAEEVVEEVVEETTTDLSDAITIEVDESELVDLTAIITDPDEDEVTYYFSEPLSDEGVWQTNYGDAGEYEVTLTATDSVFTVEQLVLLVVNRVNVAPVIDTLTSLSYAEGDEIVFEPSVDDPNGDSMVITISAPLEDGVFETDHTSAGEYEITVTASDGELETSQTFTLSIEDVNVLPIISGLEDLEVSEGETVTLDLNIEDLDGDEVVVTISDPVGDDGVWEIGFTENGEYTVTVTVDDGKDLVEESVTITVVDVNMPPEIVDVSLETE
ncbi:hypothetical protein CL619_01215 [archaeon]|nr:hypothetical protein [archaeon]